MSFAHHDPLSLLNAGYAPLLGYHFFLIYLMYCFLFSSVLYRVFQRYFQLPVSIVHISLESILNSLLLLLLLHLRFSTIAFIFLLNQ